MVCRSWSRNIFRILMFLQNFKYEKNAESWYWKVSLQIRLLWQYENSDGQIASLKVWGVNYS